MSRRNILNESISDSDSYVSPGRESNQSSYQLDYTHTPATRPHRKNPLPKRVSMNNTRSEVPRTPELSSVRRPGPRSAQKTGRHSVPNRQAQQEFDNIPTTSRTARSAVAHPRNRKQRPPNLITKERRFVRDVIALQTRKKFLVPKLPFGRLVREIIFSFTHQITHVSPEALMALQEITEMYVGQQLSDAYLLTQHRNRVTLMPKDMELLRMLKRGT